MTRQENSTALNLLRTELLSAIFSDYSPKETKAAHQARRMVEERESKIQSSYSACDDYGHLVPFFVQVKRLETSLIEAERDSSQLNKLLNQSNKRQTLVKKAINVLYGRQQFSLAQICFHLWVDTTTFQKTLTDFAYRNQQRSSNSYLMVKSCLCC